MVKIAPISANRIAEAIGGSILLSRLSKGEVFQATQLGEPLEVGSGGVAFIISESYLKDAASTKAAILVVQSSFEERVRGQLSGDVRVLIGVKDAYLGLAQLSGVLASELPYADWRVFDSDKTSDKTKTGAFAPVPPALDPTAKVAAGVSIGEGARIGPRTVLLPNVVVGPGVAIGSDCVLFPGVVLYPGTSIGDRVRIHANVVVGADGFGYARGPQGSVKIWHLGRVVVEDDVEIGAGTMIDRGTMKDTRIERGAKLDNLVQVGHNGHIKEHAILCAQVGLAGNVTVGRGAILAGKVGVADKLEIGDGALVGPMSGLSKDVKPGDQVMGQQPAKPRREWWRLIVLFEKLPEIYERLKKLESKMGGDS